MKGTTVQVIKSTGQKVFRNAKGNFISVKQVNRTNSPVRAGSLYDYKGTTVRAGAAFQRGTRLVSVHGDLHGLVKEKDLAPINKRRVNSYLGNS